LRLSVFVPLLPTTAAKRQWDATQRAFEFVGITGKGRTDCANRKRLPAFRQARARDETHWSRKDEGAMSKTPHRNVNRAAFRQRIARDEAPDNSRKMTIGKKEIFSSLGVIRRSG
jgi:hypothetical protein